MVKQRKRNNNNGKLRNSKKYNFRTGAPTLNPKAGLSLHANSLRDEHEVHALSNPFCAEARGSKIPDENNSRSIAISLVQRKSLVSSASGLLCTNVRGGLEDYERTATSLTGTVATTFSACVPVTDFTAIDAVIDEYRIVSWGVKIFPTVEPTSQSGYFQLITIPPTSTSTATLDGFDSGSSLFEEIRNFPTTDTTAQWISKPIGNEWKNYNVTTTTPSWDELVIFAAGLPASRTCFTIEVYYNIEAQVKFGSITASTATPAAMYKPAIMAAVGHVGRRASGAKTHNEFRQSIGHWVKQGLLYAGKAGIQYLGNKYGVPPEITMAAIGN